MCKGDVFKGKKITMLGLGLLGRGINVARFLAEHGALLIITDLKSKEDLQTSLLELKEFKDITYVLGEHRLEDFENRDLVIKAAGVPLDSPYIAHAKEKGIPVEMDASLFAGLVDDGVRIVGITGTRGKSTVTFLINHILKEAGKQTYLGGNVKGVATLPLLKEVKDGDIVVLELDSWQLQGFGEAEISPHVSVFTSFMPDHLNYYKGDMDLYFSDKANIFRYQNENDLLITSIDAWREIEKYYEEEIKSGVTVVTKEEAEVIELSIPGPHNQMNGALAVEACVALGVSREDALMFARTFPGIPYRLEFVREYNGVPFYNDSNATSPDAAIAALNSYPGKNIILITGGTDKNLDYKNLANEINNVTPIVILLPGTATDKLIYDLDVPYTEVFSMKEAVEQAANVACEGDVVVLSPGAASFGLFKNEYDRGDQFREFVNALK